MDNTVTIAVIGGGVVGSLITRELSKYKATIHLFEKEEDIGWGITKSNSAVIHGGYDDEPNTVRAKFCSKGNQMYTDLAEELGFEFERIGSFVVAKQPDEIKYLEKLLSRAETNGVKGCAILPREKVLEMEPRINTAIIAGFWCPSAGITEPWMVAISAAENAVKNGAILHLKEEVTHFSLRKENNKSRIVSVNTNIGHYSCDVVINASGLWADEIAEKAGAFCPSLHPRKGEYLLLDKYTPPLVCSVLFPIPTAVSKGILVLPTIDGGLLLGPTAKDLPKEEKQNTSTTTEGLSEVFESAKELIPDIDIQMTVKSFAGLRPESLQKDFVIGKTEIDGFYNAAAMRSPGLTAAPAIAKYIAELISYEIGKQNMPLKNSYNPTNTPYRSVSHLSLEEWEKRIEGDPLYGKMVCVCNKVTEGDIRDAIRRGARTIDGVKFRTRASFGRCQGGFCLSKIAEILSRETGKTLDQIKIRTGNTELLYDKVRE
jgi:glycerol-3-phosphate dehydrogenase